MHLQNILFNLGANLTTITGQVTGSLNNLVNMLFG
jgi:hypothetical protein